MMITCDTMEHFCTVCAALAREGVTFEAHTSSLEIHLTGGY